MGWKEKRCKCRTAAQRVSCSCPSSAISWRAGYVHAGRKIQATFPNEDLAKRWITSQEADILRGQHIDPANGRMIFADWADGWAASRQAVLKNSSYIAEKGRLNKHVKPFFDAFTLTQITPSRIRQWVAQLDIAPKTVRHCHALMFAIMNDAIAEGLIAKNPCVGTRLPEVVQREMVFLTDQQLAQLFTEVGDWWRPLTVLLAGTGMRWGEAVGLKVGRVDLLAGVLTVEETLNETGGRTVWSTPKTKASRRRIRLPSAVVDALLPLVAGKESAEPVFTTKQGNLVRNRVFRDRVWLPAVDRLAWAPRPRIHDLRHTHVAMLLARGVALPAIQRRLGHTSISITIDVYGHLVPTLEDALVDAIDDALAPSEEKSLSPLVPHNLRPE